MSDSTSIREAAASESGFRVRHIFFLAAVLLGLLAIFSYSPADAGYLTGGTAAAPDNWIGPLGAWFSHWCFILIGLATYVLVVLTLLRLLRACLPGKGRPMLFLTGEAMVIFGAILLFALSPYPFAYWTDRLGIGRAGIPELALSGGVIGQVLAAPACAAYELEEGFLRGKLIGAVGTLVFGWALVFGGLIVIYFSDWHRFLKEHVIAAREPGAAPQEKPFPREPEPESELQTNNSSPLSEISAKIAALFPQRRQPEVQEESAPTPTPSEQPELPVVAKEPEPAPEPVPVPPPVAAPRTAEPTTPAATSRENTVNTRVEEKGKPASAKSREYVLPPISMLSRGSDEVGEDPAIIVRSREILQRTLDSFKVPGRVTGYISGPRITRYEISLDEGVSVKKVESISDNIAMNLSAKSVRVLAPIPGRNVVGVEVPNSRSEAVFMRAVMETDAWKNDKVAIPIILGKDVAGKPVILDLAKAPHLLIAGSTGSGKSVCMNTLITSLLFKFNPDELRLIMVDPKIVEFEDYKLLPHLITPVINDSRKVPIALRWAVNEMEKRYKILARAGVKKLAEYNALASKPEFDADGLPMPDKMPILITIIDELAELMMTDARKDSETYIARIAQLGRAAGVHIVVATQRPSTQIVTGVIKANLPTRIAFRVGQMVDSRVILDQNGAEKLLGMGDMLFLAPGGMELERVQGALVADADIKSIVKFVSDQREQSFNSQVVAEEAEADEEIDPNLIDYDDEDAADIAPLMRKYLHNGDDENVKRALEVVILDRKVSTSYLQRRLKIGYNRAAEIIDLFEERGIVGPASGSGNKREILIFDDLEAGGLNE